MQSALCGVKGSGKSLIKHVEMSAVGSGREQMPAAFSLLDEFILLEGQLLLLWSCQMDLYIDLGQGGMSRGNLGRQEAHVGSSPCPAKGPSRALGGMCWEVPWIASVSKSSCLPGLGA